MIDGRWRYYCYLAQQMAKVRDFYAILGVRRDSGIDTIRKAYRSLVLRYHPDRNPDPEAGRIFLDIREAYDTLADPERRQKYDLKLQSAVSREQPSSGPRHPDPAYHPFRRYEGKPAARPKPVWRRTEFYIALGVIIVLAIAEPVYDALWKYNLRASGRESWGQVLSYGVTRDRKITTVRYRFDADGATCFGETSIRMREYNNRIALPSGLPLMPGHRFRVRYLPSRPERHYIDLEDPSDETLADLQALTAIHLYLLPFDSLLRPDLPTLDALADTALVRDGLDGLSALWKETDPRVIIDLYGFRGMQDH